MGAALQLLSAGASEHIGEHPHLPLPPLPWRTLLPQVGCSCWVCLGGWQDSLCHGLLHWKAQQQALWVCDYKVLGRIASTWNGGCSRWEHALLVVKISGIPENCHFFYTDTI